MPEQSISSITSLVGLEKGTDGERFIDVSIGEISCKKCTTGFRY